MGAQGLFILGFSLSVEVTFTFLSKSYLVHIILGNKISLSDCWNARRPSLLAMDLLQSPCRHFHPHSLCHWPGLRSLIATRLSLCLSVCHICQFTTFVNLPRLSIYHVCQFPPFVNRHPGTSHSSCMGCSTMASASTAHGCYSTPAGFVPQFSTSLIIDN